MLFSPTRLIKVIAGSHLTINRIFNPEQADNGHNVFNVGLSQYYNKSYIDSTISGINTQIAVKQDTVTGSASSIVSVDLTADKVLIAGADKTKMRFQIYQQQNYIIYRALVVICKLN